MKLPSLNPIERKWTAAAIKARYVWALSLAVLILAGALLLHQLARPRFAAQALLPNGIEIYVMQRFNWNLGERFTTGFYYRLPSGQWGWCYYDHQESWVWTGTVQLDSASRCATVFRHGKPVIRFDWETQNYHLLRRQRISTVPGAQSLRPPGWQPEWWTPDLLRTR